MKIPFVDLRAQYKSLKVSIDEAIASVISDTAFIGGKHVKSFEKLFGEYYGIDHVVTCGNGTDSLYIIMKMLGIGPGDEVITVANSWISSSETISQAGARPVFIDIEPEFHSINEQLIEEKINPATRAIIAVHLHGQPCRIDTINELCKKHNLFLVEDCAQAHFSETNGVKVGYTGIASSFSFYPGKNLGAYGDAGCIITRSAELAEKCRMFANHGSLTKHQHQMEGINSRLDGLQAAILSAKLPHIHEWTDKRIANAAFYNEVLGGIDEIILPRTRPSTKHTYHLYVIRCKKRDELKKYLEDKGVETAVHYPTALPNLPAYEYLGYKKTDFPVATQFQTEILSLPMYPELREEQVNYIADTIREFYKNNSTSH